jgi:hypothetical protein
MAGLVRSALRGKRSGPGLIRSVCGTRDVAGSTLINPDFYLIIAWLAEHFVALAFFDILLPFLI